VIHARIACLLEDGRDRSLSQKMPGWNNLLMPLTSEASQIIPELAPAPGEIVVTKTTDSALTGTNLRLVLQHGHPQCHRHRHLHRPMRQLHGAQPGRRELQRGAGRGLLRRRYRRAASPRELAIINMIYCHVVSSAELREIMGLEHAGFGRLMDNPGIRAILEQFVGSDGEPH
jgi:hypothetical protein